MCGAHSRGCWRRVLPPFASATAGPPGWAWSWPGQNPASEVYVRNKIKTVASAGCRAELFRLDASATLDEALALVARLNADEAIDGILVQSPLPDGMGADAEQRVFDAIDPAKDVDGFHPYNVGLLVQKRPALVACTPLGCIELLEREGIAIEGQARRRASAAATSSASRWRCCCCIVTRRSPSATRGRPTCRRWRGRRTSWSRRSGGPGS